MMQEIQLKILQQQSTIRVHRPTAHRDDMLSYVQQDGLTLGEIWSVGAEAPFK